MHSTKLLLTPKLNLAVSDFFLVRFQSSPWKTQSVLQVLNNLTCCMEAFANDDDDDNDNDNVVLVAFLRE